MSPELIYPEHFGFEKSSPTKSSDCYALGMVIYETISGKVPFHGCTDLTVSLKVVTGERPRQRAKFKESLWKMLELCWVPHSDDRPSIGNVLQCLEIVSNPRGPPAQQESPLRQATAIFWWKFIILLLISTPVVIYGQILYSSINLMPFHALKLCICPPILLYLRVFSGFGCAVVGSGVVSPHCYSIKTGTHDSQRGTPHPPTVRCGLSKSDPWRWVLQ